MHKNGNRERERLAAVAALLLRCLKVKIYNKTGYVLCKTAKRQKHEKMSNLMLTFLSAKKYKIPDIQKREYDVI